MDTKETIVQLAKGLADLAELAAELVGEMKARERIAQEQRKKFTLIDNLKTEEKVVEGDEMPPIWTHIKTRSRGASGLLEYRFTHDGKQRSSYGYSKKECWDNSLLIISGETKTKERTVKKKESISYTNYLEHWFELYKKPILKPGSLVDLRNNINHIKNFYKNTLITDISVQSIQELINSFNSTNLKKKIASVLSDSLRQAVLEGKLEKTPYISVKIKKKRKKPSRSLSFAEQDTLHNKTTEEELKAIVYIMACTGIGVGEFVCLTVSDFDFDNMVINVDKGMDTATHEISTTKNEYRDRKIPILNEIKKITKPLLKNKASGERIYKFNSDTLLRAISDLFNKLEIPNATSRTLRHTFASNCYAAGIPTKLYQTWMGHNEHNTTINTYTHLIKKGQSSEYYKYIKKLAKKFTHN